jgi:hypothetical protein
MFVQHLDLDSPTALTTFHERIVSPILAGRPNNPVLQCLPVAMRTLQLATGQVVPHAALLAATPQVPAPRIEHHHPWPLLLSSPASSRLSGPFAAIF